MSYEQTKQFLIHNRHIHFTTPRQLERYICELAYYRHCCPFFKLLTKRLLKKATLPLKEFKWDFIDEIAFRHLKVQMYSYNYIYHHYPSPCDAA